MSIKTRRQRREDEESALTVFAPIDPRIRSRACEEKFRHRRKPGAIKAASLMQEKTGEEFTVYECVYCGGWHIGHARQELSEAVVRLRHEEMLTWRDSKSCGMCR